MKDRIYVCHTYYHVYVACLKELNLERGKRGNATLVMSTMSNDFGDLQERADVCGLFAAVYMFDEKEDGPGKSFLKSADPHPLHEASGKGAGALCAGGL